MRPGQESFYCGLCHLCNAIPVWGLLFCGWIWYATREESRRVGVQARQAMVFHALLMTAALAYLILEILARILDVLAPLAGGPLHVVNQVIITVIYILYVGVCLWGSYRCFSGKDFRYPMIGRRGT